MNVHEEAEVFHLPDGRCETGSSCRDFGKFRKYVQFIHTEKWVTDSVQANFYNVMEMYGKDFYPNKHTSNWDWIILGLRFSGVLRSLDW
jgi:hypothetical protein